MTCVHSTRGGIADRLLRTGIPVPWRRPLALPRSWIICFFAVIALVKRLACPLPVGMCAWHPGSVALGIFLCVAIVRPRRWWILMLCCMRPRRIRPSITFLSHIQDALATQADLTWLTLDTALRKAPKTCYPKRRTVELRPWQESAVQVALKHVWQARNELRSARNTVFLGLQGIFQYWRRLATLRRTTRALRIQSHAQRRKQWCEKLRTAEEALKRHDAHHFFQVIAQLAPRQRRSRVQFRDAVGNIQSPAQELRTLHQFLE